MDTWEGPEGVHLIEVSLYIYSFKSVKKKAIANILVQGFCPLKI